MNPTPSIEVTSQPERKSRVGKVTVAVGGTVAAVAAIALLFGGEEAEATQGAAPAVAAESSASAPQSCLDALDAADESHAIAARAFEASADGFGAAAEFDVAGLEDATNRLVELRPQLEDVMDRYHAAAGECRGE